MTTQVRPSSFYMTQTLRRASRFKADRIAMVCGDRQHSWAQMRDRVARLAAGLVSLGMAEGDRVAILAQNSDRYIETMYGTWWGGGVVNGLNIRWSVKELLYALNDSASNILMVDDAYLSLVPDLRRGYPGIHTVIYAGESDPPEGMVSYEALIADNEPMADAGRCNDDLAAINYTGGTTGFPKGVMLSHTGLFTNSMTMLLEGFVEPESSYLMPNPLFHVSGIATSTSHILGGGTLIIMPSFTAKEAAELIEKYAISHANLVPTMIQMLLDMPGIESYDLGSIRHLGYGASPISQALLERAMKAFPGVKFIQAYGATELSASGAYLPPWYHTAEGIKEEKLKAAGRATYSIEIKIVDENREEVARGVVGEIAARGPNLMLGYWNKPEETAAAFTEDGWYLTGDGAYMDEDGFIYIVDRMKDMIVTGAENVYSTEVENALSQHPAVATCAVIGVPSEKWGEAVHAFVILKPGEDPATAELNEFCHEQIAGYKCPKSYDFVTDLPLSAAGKVLKNELRKRFQ